MTDKKAIIIDGKEIAKELLLDLQSKIDKDNSIGRLPAKLAILVVGNNPASGVYIKNKIRAASRVGILTQIQTFSATNTTEQELLSAIQHLNQNQNISGIIVQLPLPQHISQLKVIQSIDPAKDVDGFHPINLGLLYSPYQHRFVPCTAQGCLTLIRSCCSILTGKNIVIIGRSHIVGRPLGALLLKEDCSITICHSRTTNLQDITKRADIVISAVGMPGFLTQDHFNHNSIVIDVGINRIRNEDQCRLVGDVDFDNVKNYVQYITPVPGGVGPLTVAHLLVNTYAAKFGFKEAIRRL